MIVYVLTQRLKFLKLLFWILNSRHQTIGPLSSFLRAYWWLKANLWLSTSKMEITRLQFIYLSCHHQSNVWWKSQSLKKWVFSYLILVYKCCLLFQYQGSSTPVTFTFYDSTSPLDNFNSVWNCMWHQICISIASFYWPAGTKL